MEAYPEFAQDLSICDKLCQCDCRRKLLSTNFALLLRALRGQQTAAALWRGHENAVGTYSCRG